MAGNEVRIIGGKWKGRKIAFSALGGLRPSLGRARETLFNWLAADITGARCLDLFAGSGALGLEALSRGAAEVTFVERNRIAARSLKDNLARLSADNATVHAVPAQRFLKRAEAQWDIIFLDPPCGSGALEPTLAAMGSRQLLHPQGWVYVEQPRRESLQDVPGWQVVKQSTAGDTLFALWRTIHD